MSNLIFFLGLLVLCVDAGYDYPTYTANSSADKIKDNPGKCFAPVGNVGLMNKDAESKVSGSCMTIKCLDGGKYQINTCPPLVLLNPMCYAVYPDKPFPECCTFELQCLPEALLGAVTSPPIPTIPVPKFNV